MQNQLIFQDDKEKSRLGVQKRLLSCYEAPAFAHVFSAKKGLAVLDIGCNDGTKTVERFSADAVEKVIGLEFNEALAKSAQLRYGDDRFSFYSCDVECPDWPEKMKKLMEDKGIDGFDVIYLSFVLMHLRAPERLLGMLQQFLKPDGHLMIVEADDGASVLTPDEERLLPDFLSILSKDRYSGNREIGGRLEEMLAACGFGQVVVWCDRISAGKGEDEKKKDIFDTFFSYLPEDVALLRGEVPENEDYRIWADWLKHHYCVLKRLIMQEDSTISMGMKIVSCMKGIK